MRHTRGRMVTTALAVAAAAVALAFAMLTFERWLVRRRPYDLAWSISLLLFFRVGGFETVREISCRIHTTGWGTG